MIRHTIKLTLITFIFYATGRLAYEYFYQLTISLVKSFSTVPLRFFGKFPFLFFGDPAFGLIIASIPSTIFLISRIHPAMKRITSVATILYTIYFSVTYSVVCWVTSIGLLASNDFYKDGQALWYSIRQIDPNEIFLITIVVSAILTSATLTTIKVIAKYKSNKIETGIIGSNV